MLCPICEKRKAARHCPAKGEKICSVCCGTEREVSIDCPVDCVHLVTAYRYEDQHPRELPANAPLLDVAVPSDIIRMHEQLMAQLALTIAKFCAANRAATDSDVLAALQALGETYKTLSSGIYYETQAASTLARDLSDTLNKFIAGVKQQAATAARPKDSEILSILVFLYRMGLLRTNGRPRSRRLVEFLRSQFHGVQELRREESRIIVP